MTQTIGKQQLFTIITVTLNNLKGLKRTEESINRQTCHDFEWIVVDGGSSDNSVNYLRSLSLDGEGRGKGGIKWISQPDNGIYDAMNKGIARANGQYLLFLNAGDTLVSPDTLQKTKTAAVNSHAFIYGDALEGNAYKPARAPNIVRGMFTHHQAMLYKRKDIERLRYDTLYKIAADYDFTARFLLSLNCHPRDFAQQNLNSGDPQSEPHSGSQKILYCPFPFCNFQPGGISQQQAALGRREQYQIRKNLKLTGPLQNLIITGFQVLAWKLRQIAPALYWRLKSSGNNAPAIAQSDTRPSHPKTPA